MLTFSKGGILAVLEKRRALGINIIAGMQLTDDIIEEIHSFPEYEINALIVAALNDQLYAEHRSTTWTEMRHLIAMRAVAQAHEHIQQLDHDD